MAKRGAEGQITKDDHDDRGDEEDPGTRERPLAPIEGRVIRGMPKRKANAAEPPATNPAPSAENAPKSAFSGFSFGSTSASAPAPSFSFGASASAAASSAPAPAAVSPFSGFSFKPVAPAAAAASANTGEKRSAEDSSEPAAKKPFSGFSFATPAAAPTASATTSSTQPNPFSFGASSTAGQGSNTTSSVAQPAAAGFTFEQSASASSAPVPSTASGDIAFGQPQESDSSGPQSNGSNGPSSRQTDTSSSFATSSAPKPASSTPPPEGEVKYYTALRGLNASILSFLTSTLEKDAFADLGSVLPGLGEQYKRYLDQEATKAGWRPSVPSTSFSAIPPAKPVEEPRKAPVAPPVAPSGGFSFGGRTSTSSAPSTSTGKGFTPSVSASGSSSSPFAFNFGSKLAEPAKPAETPKKPSAAVTKLVEDAISGTSDEAEKKEELPAAKPYSFNFGAPAATPDKKAGSSLFAFAPSSPLKPATPNAKSFSPSTNVESVSSSTPPARLGKFGPGGSAPQLAFGGASSSTSTPGGTKSTGFVFGAPSSESGGGFSLGSGEPFSSQIKVPENMKAPSFSFGTGSSTASGDKPAPSFQFGTPASKSSSFSFGAPSGSPSFSFGQQQSQATPPQSSKPASFSPAFASFAVPPYSETDTNSSKPNGPTGPAEDTTAADQAEAPTSESAAGDEPQAAEPAVNLAATAGAGEEGEETLTEMRAKLYKLVEGKYVAVGLGSIKLKKKTENGKRRLLMRTEGAGSVILNMAVTASLAPSAEKAVVKFVGTDLEGQPMVYNLRVKTPQMASDFVDTVKTEVEAIKSA